MHTTLGVLATLMTRRVLKKVFYLEGGVAVRRWTTISIMGLLAFFFVFLNLNCSSQRSDNTSDDVVAANSAENSVQDPANGANVAQSSNAAKDEESQNGAAGDDQTKEADELNSAGTDETEKTTNAADGPANPKNAAQTNAMQANALPADAGNPAANGTTQLANAQAAPAGNLPTSQNGALQENMNTVMTDVPQQNAAGDAASINSVPTQDPAAQQAAAATSGEAVNSASTQLAASTQSPGQQPTAEKTQSQTAPQTPALPQKAVVKDEVQVQQENMAAKHYAEETHALPADLYPVNALVYWVGYDYQAEQRKVVVRVLTHGKPQFSLQQEHNSAGQPELVIRFLQASLRNKIGRDIDATEFRSPVAYCRMRENRTEEYVDVILTFREQANPRVFAKDGNVQLTFDLPDHYFAPKGDGKQTAVAEDLSSVVINPQFDPESDMPSSQVAKAEPKPYAPDPGSREFKAAPADGGVPASNIIQDPATSGEGEQPADFDTSPNSNLNHSNQGVMLKAKSAKLLTASSDENLPESFFTISSFSIGAVGQFGEGDFQNQSSPSNVPAMNTNDTGIGAMTQNAAASAPQQSALASDITGSDMETPAAQYSGKPILLDFNDADLYLVLQAITNESGYNFVYPGAVGTTKITLRLLNVPWDEALKAILETHGLTMVPVGTSVMRIDTIDNITKFLQSKEQSEIFKQRQIETKILVMRLSNGKASNIVESLNKVLVDAVAKDPRVKASADDRTNSIVVEAPEHILAKVKSIVERMDLETPQVEIEARIVEVNRNVDNTFGISWNGMMKYDPGRGLGFGSLVFPNSVASDFSVDPGVNSWNNASGGMSLKFGSLNKFLDLDLVLKMEERRGIVNVLQTNKLIVLDREDANILAGSTQFFRGNAGSTITVGGGAAAGAGAAGGAAAGGLSEVTFNLSLDVIPEITASGLVNMKVSIKSDTPGDLTGEAVANKSTRELNTKMSLKSGDTAVIGGIYDTKTTRSVVGIPYLMDIPLLGFLFRKTSAKESQMELLIMVTPRILSKTDSGQTPLSSAASSAPEQGAGQQNANTQNFSTQNGSLNSAAATKPARSGNVATNAVDSGDAADQQSGAEDGAAQATNSQSANGNAGGDAATNQAVDDATNESSGSEAGQE